MKGKILKRQVILDLATAAGVFIMGLLFFYAFNILHKQFGFFSSIIPRISMSDSLSILPAIIITLPLAIGVFFGIRSKKKGKLVFLRTFLASIATAGVINLIIAAVIFIGVSISCSGEDCMAVIAIIFPIILFVISSVIAVIVAFLIYLIPGRKAIMGVVLTLLILMVILNITVMSFKANYSDIRDSGFCTPKDYQCKAMKAVETNDMSICEEMTEAQQFDPAFFCYRYVAIIKQDESLCTEPHFGTCSEVWSCYTEIAKEKSDIAICDMMKEDNGRSDCPGFDRPQEKLGMCYINIASKTKDLEICRLIEYEGSKDKCFYSMAWHFFDGDSVCDEIADEETKSGCRERIVYARCREQINGEYVIKELEDRQKCIDEGNAALANS